MSPIDNSVFTDVESLNNLKHEQNTDAYFTEEQVESLKQYIFDSLEMQRFLNAYLERTGLDREGWETEIRTDIKSFVVSAITKKIKIPSGFMSPAAREFPATGVVGLVEHEVGGKKAGHVVQSVNTSRNPEMFEIAKSPKFRGKRYLAMREAGGTSAEADAMDRFFGQNRRFSTSYASAMASLLGGGSHSDAVKAFAEAQINGRTVTDEERQKTFELAADRVMRLLREGGVNSQPIQYVEAATVRKVAMNLPEGVVDSMFAEAVYDPVDMMRLHKFGLLNTDSEHRFKPDEDPEQITKDLLREMYESRIS